MEQTLTDEQKQDVQDRMEEFKKRHLVNVEELGIDFVTFPQYVQIAPDVFGTANGMQMVDRKYAPVPSPVTQEDVAGGEILEA